MNKRKAPIIPPIRQGNTFVTNVAEKASLFNNFFANQCTLINKSSSLPNFEFITNGSLDRLTLVMKTYCFSLIQTKHTSGMKFLLEC